MASTLIVFGVTADGHLLCQGITLEGTSTPAIHHVSSVQKFEAETWSGEHEEHHDESRRESLLACELHTEPLLDEDTPIVSSTQFERPRAPSLAAALLELDPTGAPSISFYQPSESVLSEEPEPEDAEQTLARLLFTLRAVKMSATDKHAEAVQRLKELEQELREAGAVTPADPAVADAVARALAAAGPGRDIQIRVNQSRHTTTTKTVYETETPGMVGLDSEKVRELHKQMLESLTAGAAEATPETGTTQKKETAEEGFTEEDGSVVVSKKMTRVVTTTKTTLPGEGEPLESSTESLGSVRDRIAKFESLKDESPRSETEKISIDIVVTPGSPLPPLSDLEEEAHEPLSPVTEATAAAEVKELASPRSAVEDEEDVEALTPSTEEISTADVRTHTPSSSEDEGHEGGRKKKRFVGESSTTTTYDFSQKYEEKKHPERGEEGMEEIEEHMVEHVEPTPSEKAGESPVEQEAGVSYTVVEEHRKVEEAEESDEEEKQRKLRHIVEETTTTTTYTVKTIEREEERREEEEEQPESPKPIHEEVTTTTVTETTTVSYVQPEMLEAREAEEPEALGHPEPSQKAEEPQIPPVTPTKRRTISGAESDEEAEPKRKVRHLIDESSTTTTYTTTDTFTEEKRPLRAEQGVEEQPEEEAVESPKEESKLADYAKKAGLIAAGVIAAPVAVAAMGAGALIEKLKGEEEEEEMEGVVHEPAIRRESFEEKPQPIEAEEEFGAETEAVPTAYSPIEEKQPAFEEENVRKGEVERPEEPSVGEPKEAEQEFVEENPSEPEPRHIVEEEITTAYTTERTYAEEPQRPEDISEEVVRAEPEPEAEEQKEQIPSPIHEEQPIHAEEETVSEAHRAPEEEPEEIKELPSPVEKVKDIEEEQPFAPAEERQEEELFEVEHKDELEPEIEDHIEEAKETALESEFEHEEFQTGEKIEEKYSPVMETTTTTVTAERYSPEIGTEHRISEVEPALVEREASPSFEHKPEEEHIIRETITTTTTETVERTYEHPEEVEHFKREKPSEAKEPKEYVPSPKESPIEEAANISPLEEKYSPVEERHVAAERYSPEHFEAGEVRPDEEQIIREEREAPEAPEEESKLTDFAKKAGMVASGIIAAPAVLAAKGAEALYEKITGEEEEEYPEVIHEEAIRRESNEEKGEHPGHKEYSEQEGIVHEEAIRRESHPSVELHAEAEMEKEEAYPEERFAEEPSTVHEEHVEVYERHEEPSPLSEQFEQPMFEVEEKKTEIETEPSSFALKEEDNASTASLPRTPVSEVEAEESGAVIEEKQFDELQPEPIQEERWSTAATTSSLREEDDLSVLTGVTPLEEKEISREEEEEPSPVEKQFEAEIPQQPSPAEYKAYEPSEAHIPYEQEEAIAETLAEKILPEHELMTHEEKHIPAEEPVEEPSYLPESIEEPTLEEEAKAEAYTEEILPEHEVKEHEHAEQEAEEPSYRQEHEEEPTYYKEEAEAESITEEILPEHKIREHEHIEKEPQESTFLPEVAEEPTFEEEAKAEAYTEEIPPEHKIREHEHFEHETEVPSYRKEFEEEPAFLKEEDESKAEIMPEHKRFEEEPIEPTHVQPVEESLPTEVTTTVEYQQEPVESEAYHDERIVRETITTTTVTHYPEEEIKETVTTTTTKYEPTETGDELTLTRSITDVEEVHGEEQEVEQAPVEPSHILPREEVEEPSEELYERRVETAGEPYETKPCAEEHAVREEGEAPESLEEESKFTDFAKKAGMVAAGIIAAPAVLAAKGAEALYEKITGEEEEEYPEQEGVIHEEAIRRESYEEIGRAGYPAEELHEEVEFRKEEAYPEELYAEEPSAAKEKHVEIYQRHEEPSPISEQMEFHREVETTEEAAPISPQIQETPFTPEAEKVPEFYEEEELLEKEKEVTEAFHRQPSEEEKEEEEFPFQAPSPITETYHEDLTAISPEEEQPSFHAEPEKSEELTTETSPTTEGESAEYILEQPSAVEEIPLDEKEEEPYRFEPSEETEEQLFEEKIQEGYEPLEEEEDVRTEVHAEYPEEELQLEHREETAPIIEHEEKIHQVEEFEASLEQALKKEAVRRASVEQLFRQTEEMEAHAGDQVEEKYSPIMETRTTTVTAERHSPELEHRISEEEPALEREASPTFEHGPKEEHIVQETVTTTTTETVERTHVHPEEVEHIEREEPSETEEKREYIPSPKESTVEETVPISLSEEKCSPVEEKHVAAERYSLEHLEAEEVRSAEEQIIREVPESPEEESKFTDFAKKAGMVAAGIIAAPAVLAAKGAEALYEKITGEEEEQYLEQEGVVHEEAIRRESYEEKVEVPGYPAKELHAEAELEKEEAYAEERFAEEPSAVHDEHVEVYERHEEPSPVSGKEEFHQVVEITEKASPSIPEVRERHEEPSPVSGKEELYEEIETKEEAAPASLKAREPQQQEAHPEETSEEYQIERTEEEAPTETSVRYSIDAITRLATADDTGRDDDSVRVQQDEEDAAEQEKAILSPPPSEAGETMPKDISEEDFLAHNAPEEPDYQKEQEYFEEEDKKLTESLKEAGTAAAGLIAAPFVAAAMGAEKLYEKITGEDEEEMKEKQFVSSPSTEGPEEISPAEPQEPSPLAEEAPEEPEKLYEQYEEPEPLPRGAIVSAVTGEGEPVIGGVTEISSTMISHPEEPYADLPEAVMEAKIHEESPVAEHAEAETLPREAVVSGLSTEGEPVVEGVTEASTIMISHPEEPYAGLPQEEERLTFEEMLRTEPEAEEEVKEELPLQPLPRGSIVSGITASRHPICQGVTEYNPRVISYRKEPFKYEEEEAFVQREAVTSMYHEQPPSPVFSEDSRRDFSQTESGSCTTITTIGTVYHRYAREAPDTQSLQSTEFEDESSIGDKLAGFAKKAGMFAAGAVAAPVALAAMGAVKAYDAVQEMKEKGEEGDVSPTTSHTQEFARYGGEKEVTQQFHEEAESELTEEQLEKPFEEEQLASPTVREPRVFVPERRFSTEEYAEKSSPVIEEHYIVNPVSPTISHVEEEQKYIEDTETRPFYAEEEIEKTTHAEEDHFEEKFVSSAPFETEPEYRRLSTEDLSSSVAEEKKPDFDEKPEGQAFPAEISEEPLSTTRSSVSEAYPAEEEERYHHEPSPKPSDEAEPAEKEVVFEHFEQKMERETEPTHEAEEHIESVPSIDITTEERPSVQSPSERHVPFFESEVVTHIEQESPHKKMASQHSIEEPAVMTESITSETILYHEPVSVTTEAKVETHPESEEEAAPSEFHVEGKDESLGEKLADIAKKAGIAISAPVVLAAKGAEALIESVTGEEEVEKAVEESYVSEEKEEKPEFFEAEKEPTEFEEEKEQIPAEIPSEVKFGELIGEKSVSEVQHGEEEPLYEAPASSASNEEQTQVLSSPEDIDVQELSAAAKFGSEASGVVEEPPSDEELAQKIEEESEVAYTEVYREETAEPEIALHEQVGHIEPEDSGFLDKSAREESYIYGDESKETHFEVSEEEEPVQPSAEELEHREKQGEESFGEKLTDLAKTVMAAPVAAAAIGAEKLYEAMTGEEEPESPKAQHFTEIEHLAREPVAVEEYAETVAETEPVKPPVTEVEFDHASHDLEDYVMPEEEGQISPSSEETELSYLKTETSSRGSVVEHLAPGTTAPIPSPVVDDAVYDHIAQNIVEEIMATAQQPAELKEAKPTPEESEEAAVRIYEYVAEDIMETVLPEAEHDISVELGKHHEPEEEVSQKLEQEETKDDTRYEEGEELVKEQVAHEEHRDISPSSTSSRIEHEVPESDLHREHYVFRDLDTEAQPQAHEEAQEEEQLYQEEKPADVHFYEPTSFDSERDLQKVITPESPAERQPSVKEHEPEESLYEEEHREVPVHPETEVDIEQIYQRQDFPREAHEAPEEEEEQLYEPRTETTYTFQEEPESPSFGSKLASFAKGAGKVVGFAAAAPVVAAVAGASAVADKLKKKGEKGDVVMQEGEETVYSFKGAPETVSDEEEEEGHVIESSSYSPLTEQRVESSVRRAEETSIPREDSYIIESTPYESHAEEPVIKSDLKVEFHHEPEEQLYEAEESAAPTKEEESYVVESTHYERHVEEEPVLKSDLEVEFKHEHKAGEELEEEEHVVESEPYHVQEGLQVDERIDVKHQYEEEEPHIVESTEYRHPEEPKVRSDLDLEAGKEAEADYSHEEYEFVSRSEAEDQEESHIIPSEEYEPAIRHSLEELALDNVTKMRFETSEDFSPEKQSRLEQSSSLDEPSRIADEEEEEDEWKVYDSQGKVLEDFSDQLTHDVIEEAETSAVLERNRAGRRLMPQESCNDVAMEPEVDYHSDLQEKLDILAQQNIQNLPTLKEDDLQVIHESETESEEHEEAEIIDQTAARIVDEVLDNVLDENKTMSKTTSKTESAAFYTATESKDDQYDTCVTSQEDTFDTPQGWTSQDSEYTTATSNVPSRLSDVDERTLTPQAVLSPVDSDRQFTVNLDYQQIPPAIRQIMFEDETARSTPDVPLQVTIEEDENEDNLPTSPSGVLLAPQMDAGRPISPVPPRPRSEEDEGIFVLPPRAEHTSEELEPEEEIQLYTRQTSELSTDSRADTVIHKEESIADEESVKSTGRMEEEASPREPEDISPRSELAYLPEVSPVDVREETDEDFVLYTREEPMQEQGELETVEEEPEDNESLNGSGNGSSSGPSENLGLSNKYKHVSSDNVSLTSLQEFERLEQLVAAKGDTSLTSSELELYTGVSRLHSTEGSKDSLAEFERTEQEIGKDLSPQDEMMLSVVKEESEVDDMSIRDDEEEDNQSIQEAEMKTRPVQEEDLRAATPLALSPSDSLGEAIVENFAVLETSTDSLEPSFQRVPEAERERSMTDSLTEFEVVPTMLQESLRDSLENIPDKDSLLEGGGTSQEMTSQETRGLSGDTVGTYQEHEEDDKDSLGGEIEGMLRSYPTTLTTFETTAINPDGTVETISRRVETRVRDPVLSHVQFTGTESEERLRDLPLEEQLETIDAEGNVTRTTYRRFRPQS